MQRRTALRAAGGLLACGTLPVTNGGGSAFEPRSHLPLPGAKEAVVGPDGRTAYVAVTDGFATVDVTDPSRPAVLAERRGVLADRDRGPIDLVQDLAVDGDRLAVAGPAHGLGLGGVVLYDVSDPADPAFVAFHEVPYPVHNCDLSGGFAYLTANNVEDNPLAIVDARGDDPHEVATWSIYHLDDDWSAVSLSARMLHDVTVEGGVACCAYWDAGTWLLDVTDPTSPRLLGNVGGFTPEEYLAMDKPDRVFERLEPPGNAHYAELDDDGDLLAVGGESWDVRAGDGHGGPSGIDLWDVSDPASPEHRGRIDPLVPRDATREGTWTTAHNFELTGGRLYSSWYQDGVKLHDVSEPSSPEELAHWRAPAESWFWTAQLARPGEFFVAADMGDPDGEGEDAGLYCFPDAAGSQPDQPPIETATPTPTDTPTRTRSPTGGGSTTDRTTVPSTPSSHTRTTPPSPRTAETTETVPGVGVVGALGVLGLAAWRHRSGNQ